MPTIVIDLYDIGVLVSDGSQVLIDSASCALIESYDSIIIGEAASQQARLRPREISTQFWGQLSSNSNTKLVVSNAELAFRHLRSIWKELPKNEYEVIVAIPNTFSKQDLGLLLGICEKLSIPVVGIVSNAVFVAQSQIPNCKTVYLDLLQHRIAITELNYSGDNISVSQPNKILSYGLHSLMNYLAKDIAAKFIAETRFDPMHLAADEQQFFDKLPLWLNTLKISENIKCSLTSDLNTYSVELDKEYLSHANQKAFNDIANFLNMLFHNHETIAIVCSASCSQVFGLLDFLKTLPGCAVIPIEKKTISKNALLNKELVKSEVSSIHYTTAINCDRKISDLNIKFNPGALSKLADVPTHVLFNNQAYAIQKDLFVARHSSRGNLLIQSINDEDAVCKISKKGILVEVEKLNNCIVKCNKEPLNVQTPVQVGDCLYIDDHTTAIQFIKVHQNETQND